MIVTGTDLESPEGFEVPFARTADYFGMIYRGGAYAYTEGTYARRMKSRSQIWARAY